MSDSWPDSTFGHLRRVLSNKELVDETLMKGFLPLTPYWTEQFRSLTPYWTELFHPITPQSPPQCGPKSARVLSRIEGNQLSVNWVLQSMSHRCLVGNNVKNVLLLKNIKFTFVFFSIVWHASTKCGKPAPKAWPASIYIF